MRITLTFVAIFIVTITSGQSIGKIGLKFGLNSSHQSLSNKDVGSIRVYSSGEVSSTSKNIQGFNFGIASSVNLTKVITFRPGLIYSSKGQVEEIKEDFQGGGFTYEDRINYLELPLYFSFDLGKANNKGVFLSAGFYLAYGIGGESKFSYPYNNGQEENADIKFVSEIQQRDGNDPYDLLVKRGDFGLKSGIGYKFGNAIFEITYDLGLTDINPQIAQPRQNSNDQEWNDRVKRNRVIAFNFEYLIFNF